MFFRGRVVNPVTGQLFGTGWQPQPPDMRDADRAAKLRVAFATTIGLPSSSKSPALPTKTDLRPWCSPVEDQGRIGSCTANAAVGIVEYFEIVNHGHYADRSRLFIYKATRNLMRVQGDTGAYLRSTMGALVRFGAPEEEYWPYTDDPVLFDTEPSGFLYSAADDFVTTGYLCHDPFGAGLNPKDVLLSVKTFLSRKIPAMFGFYGFGSFDHGDTPGAIPIPGPTEKAEWGHAVAAMGYDDNKVVANRYTGVKSSKGALLIRNSWGPAWGEQGYGWLPYDYVLNWWATDFWSLLDMKWVDTAQFKAS